MVSGTSRVSHLFLALSLVVNLTFGKPAPTALAIEVREEDLLSTQKTAPVDDGILRDKAYLPAQIGGIVGAYAVSLVLVAITLLVLSKRRREHLAAGKEEVAFEQKVFGESPVDPPEQNIFKAPLDLGLRITTTDLPPVQNFSYPSPIRTDFNNQAAETNPYFLPSPASTVGAPGVSPLVDQRIVAADRVMAQSQLELMYKHVLEHEEAKERGEVYRVPGTPADPHQKSVTSFSERPISSPAKKERNKPASLNLKDAAQSRASSLLSALRSPKKKSMKGMSISSPIMTPQSATFRPEEREMNTIPPRHYHPASPPPVPTEHPFGAVMVQSPKAPKPPIEHPFGAIMVQSPTAPKAPRAPITPPDISPESVQSIDERLGSQYGHSSHLRVGSRTSTTGEFDPDSAISEHSSAPLVGLPTSPKSRSRFPPLPASPKPGATFQRAKSPSAVRTNGSLPLRAYASEIESPETIASTTKQTVFERKGPLSPGGGMTPFTASAVPYTPYQPYTPCVPVTPSLVTKEDRKRMRRLVPKTPTLAMVRSDDEIW